MPTSCDRTSNYGGKGTFVIFACILGLGLTRTKLAARLKIQAKMTKVPFPPEFEVLSQLVGFRGCPWCKICRKTDWGFFSALGEPVARCEHILLDSLNDTKSSWSTTR